MYGEESLDASRRLRQASSVASPTGSDVFLYFHQTRKALGQGLSVTEISKHERNGLRLWGRSSHTASQNP